MYRDLTPCIAPQHVAAQRGAGDFLYEKKGILAALVRAPLLKASLMHRSANFHAAGSSQLTSLPHRNVTSDGRSAPAWCLCTRYPCEKLKSQPRIFLRDVAISRKPFRKSVKEKYRTTASSRTSTMPNRIMRVKMLLTKLRIVTCKMIARRFPGRVLGKRTARSHSLPISANS
jgi:hypothetical protein